MLRPRSKGPASPIAISTEGPINQVESQSEDQPPGSTPGRLLPKLSRLSKETVLPNSASWFCPFSSWASYAMQRANLIAQRVSVLILALVVLAVVRLSLSHTPMNSPVKNNSSPSPVERGTQSGLPPIHQTTPSKSYYAAYTSKRTAASRKPMQADSVNIPDNSSEGVYQSSLQSLFLPVYLSGSWRYPTVSRSMLEKLDLATPPYPDTDSQDSFPTHVDVPPETLDEFTLDIVDSTLPFAHHAVSPKSKKLPLRVLDISEPRSKSVATHTQSGSSTRPSTVASTNLAHSPTTLNNLTGVCPSVIHDRFLLPLRIAEQESKSRLHFVQLMHLAKALNRTLVLPNVGKSRMGACGKWKWGVYYDEEGLKDGGWITMDEFQEWTAHKDQGSDSQENITSQLLSVGTSIPANAQHGYRPVIDQYAVDRVSVFAYASSSSPSGTTDRLGDPVLRLPGCFTTKYPHLTLEVNPMFVTIPQSAKINSVAKGLFEEVINAFQQVTSIPSSWSASDSFNEREELLTTSNSHLQSKPQVLVVNWDLRYPIFPSSYLRALNSEIKYSPQLLKLAKKLAPSEPYLAVHWRMETVAVWDKISDVVLDVGRGVSLNQDEERSVLDDCAYSLVDVITRTVGQYEREAHNQESSGRQVRTVWFASDYPYPIAGTTESVQRHPAVKAKSGTFRSFSFEHERAVDVLRKAFESGGDLEDRTIRDVAGQIEEDMRDMGERRREQLTEEEKELLDDPGILGIMDKLISTNAAIFVSGSQRCSKKSSFTKQVLDSRMDRWRKHEKRIWNVVDTFG